MKPTPTQILILIRPAFLEELLLSASALNGLLSSSRPECKRNTLDLADSFPREHGPLPGLSDPWALSTSDPWTLSTTDPGLCLRLTPGLHTCPLGSVYVRPWALSTSDTWAPHLTPWLCPHQTPGLCLRLTPWLCLRLTPGLHI